MTTKTRTLTRTLFADLLATYTPFDEDEVFHLQQFRQFLSETGNAYDRSNLLGHIVADAWIVNPQRDQVVLLEHPLNNTWLAPGGHCDGNPDVFASAVREAEEETGLTELKPLLGGDIYDLNVHPIPIHEKDGQMIPAHLHLGACFAFEAPHNAPLTISEESNKLAWVPIAKIKEFNYLPSHTRRITKTHARLL